MSTPNIRSDEDRVLDEIDRLTAERDALKAERAEIGEYLWPNQTGLPNDHRNILIAVKMREQLLRARVAELEKHLQETIEMKTR